MTKIFCPIAGCNKSYFGVAEPHQYHLNRHLHKKHGVEVTSGNITQYRRRQDEAWQARVDHLEAVRSAQAKRFREEFEAFSNDPSRVLPTETLDEGVEEELNALMDTHDDEDVEYDAEPVQNAHALEAKAASEWFGKGPSYDPSCRTLEGRDNAIDSGDTMPVLSDRLRQGAGLPSGSDLDHARDKKTKTARDSISKGNCDIHGEFDRQS